MWCVRDASYTMEGGAHPTILFSASAKGPLALILPFTENGKQIIDNRILGGDHGNTGTDAAGGLVSQQCQRLPGGNRAICGRGGAALCGRSGLWRHCAPRRLV